MMTTIAKKITKPEFNLLAREEKKTMKLS